MYRPKTNNTEFIEVLNNSSRTSLALGNLRLTASNLEFTFPSGTTLGPGAFLLVVRNRPALKRRTASVYRSTGDGPAFFRHQATPSG